MASRPYQRADDGRAAEFPQCRADLSKLENDYWSVNPSDAYTANVAPLVANARQIGDGDEILPGIRAEAARHDRLTRPAIPPICWKATGKGCC